MRLGLTLALGALLPVLGCVANELDGLDSVQVDTHVDDWRDEVIYQLMTDRFANGDPRNDHRVDPSSLARYQGGDYQGIIDKLDYLEELGVTALWISPIVLNVDADAGFDAYHGYWAVNLHRLNPHFGDLATLRKLVRDAHARDIKVILDIVTNHLGQVFYYDINNNGQPDEWLSGSGTNGMAGESTSTHNGELSRVTEYDPDYDPRGVQGFTSLGLSGRAPIRFFDMPEIWRVPPEPAILQKAEAYNRRGRVTDWSIPEQVEKGDFPGGLKDLNTLNPKVQEALIDAYVRWVLETDLDGFRIDTIKHVEVAFWKVFAPEVRKRLARAGKTKFLMFGEAFVGAELADDQLEGRYTFDDMVDSVFYFPQRHRVFNGVFRRGAPTREVETLLTWRGQNYGAVPHPGGPGIAPQKLLVNFMDNHDQPRFLFQDGEEYERPICADHDNCAAALKAALVYLLTEEGIPCIYYGTEQDFDGGNDPGNREPLWWSDYRTDGETFRFIRTLTKLRREHAALRRGDLGLRWVTDHVGDEQDAGMLAFERVTKQDYALVVINTHPTKRSETSTIAAGGNDMSVSLPAGTVLRDTLGILREPVTVSADQTLRIALPPYGAAVLVPAD